MLSLASCFHEAGHAVAMVALDLGDLLGEVRVHPNTSGYVQITVPPDASSADASSEERDPRERDELLFKLCILYAAGREAQREFDPNGNDDIVIEGADRDITISWWFIRRMSRAMQRGMPIKAERHARALVRKQWKAVAVLALHIHECGTLSGAEARALIEGHMEPDEEGQEVMVGTG